MHTASSANRTWRLSLSAVEYTATVLIPISLQVRMILKAISPLLAISILLNTVKWIGEFIKLSCWIYQKQGLVIFYRRGVFNQNFDNFSGDFRFDFIEKFHGLNDTHCLTGNDIIPHIHKRIRIGIGRSVKGTDHR